MKYKIISYLPRSNRTLLQMAKIPTCSSTPNCREGSIFILFTNDISHSFKLSCLCENISFYGRCFVKAKICFFRVFYYVLVERKVTARSQMQILCWSADLSTEMVFLGFLQLGLLLWGFDPFLSRYQLYRSTLSRVLLNPVVRPQDIKLIV